MELVIGFALLLLSGGFAAMVGIGLLRRMTQVSGQSRVDPQPEIEHLGPNGEYQPGDLGGCPAGVCMAHRCAYLTGDPHRWEEFKDARIPEIRVLPREVRALPVPKPALPEPQENPTIFDTYRDLEGVYHVSPDRNLRQ